MLYAKRLERGRFIWPATVDGAAPLTMEQLGYLLKDVDRRTRKRFGGVHLLVLALFPAVLVGAI